MATKHHFLLAVLAPFGLAAQGLCVLMVAGLGFGILLSRATPLCPLSHKTRDLVWCEISDRRGDWVLIQHAELDLNELYVEVRSRDGSIFYKPPSNATVFIQEDL